MFLTGILKKKDINVILGEPLLITKRMKVDELLAKIIKEVGEENK